MSPISSFSFLVLLMCALPQTSRVQQCVELIGEHKFCSGTVATCSNGSEANCTETLQEPLDNECACLFNHMDTAGDCTAIPESLGLNCSSPDSPVEYILDIPNDSKEDDENETLCVLERVCQCLSRKANHSVLLEIEDTCRESCSLRNREKNPGLGNPRDSVVCHKVHSQYCRRLNRHGKCASYCAQEDYCVSI